VGETLLLPEQYSGPWLVSRLLIDRAEKFPEKVAIWAEQENLTYAELAQRAACFAGGLSQLGIKPGDRHDASCYNHLSNRMVRGRLGWSN
jgi:non-ribosomal peptide synthetase component E (peptide arylation enzyme)